MKYKNKINRIKKWKTTFFKIIFLNYLSITWYKRVTRPPAVSIQRSSPINKNKIQNGRSWNYVELNSHYRRNAAFWGHIGKISWLGPIVYLSKNLTVVFLYVFQVNLVVGIIFLIIVFAMVLYFIRRFRRQGTTWIALFLVFPRSVLLSL